MISQHQHQEVCDELQSAQERVAKLEKENIDLSDSLHIAYLKGKEDARGRIVGLLSHVELLKGELAQVYIHEFGYSYDDAVKQVELVFTIQEEGE
jgi:hypothetical protein